MKKNEHGMAHMMLLGLLVIVLVGGAGYYVVSKNKTTTKNSVETKSVTDLTAPLPTDLKTVEEIKTIATTDTPDVALTSVELENENGTFLYKVKLANGTILFFNAKTGEKVTHDAGETEASDGDIPAGFVAAISYDKAREIALAQKAGGTITKISLESEEGKVVYVVRFSDDARIYVDATSGSIVKTKPAKTTTSSGSSNSDSTSGSSSDSSSDDTKTGSSDDSNKTQSGSDDSSGSHGGSGSNSGSGSSHN